MNFRNSKVHLTKQEKILPNSHRWPLNPGLHIWQLPVSKWQFWQLISGHGMEQFCPKYPDLEHPWINASENIMITLHKRFEIYTAFKFWPSHLNMHVVTEHFWFAFTTINFYCIYYFRTTYFGPFLWSCIFNQSQNI